MKIIGKFLIILFVAISIMGTFGMHTMMSDHKNDCIASIVRDNDCPTQVGSLDYLAFHINAYTNFFLGVFGNNILNTLSLIIVLLTISILYLNTSYFIDLSKRVLYRYRFKKPPLSHQEQKLNHWLALLTYAEAKY